MQAGSATDNPAVFLGGLGYWNEPSLGLDYLRARWLNPATGSWLSADQTLMWMPGILSGISPPGFASISPLEPWYISYAGGFLFGALEAAISQLVSLPADVLRLIAYCLSRPNILKDIQTGIGAMRTNVSEINDLAPYERGKAIGRLVAGVGLGDDA